MGLIVAGAAGRVLTTVAGRVLVAGAGALIARGLRGGGLGSIDLDGLVEDLDRYIGEQALAQTPGGPQACDGSTASARP